MQNFTKLEISPRYGNTQLQPGENKEMIVTIKNKETKSITVSPIVVVSPYGEYLMDKEWITVSPANIEIPAGASQKFTLKVVIPGRCIYRLYNANIAFTDERCRHHIRTLPKLCAFLQSIDQPVDASNDPDIKSIYK